MRTGQERQTDGPNEGIRRVQRQCVQRCWYWHGNTICSVALCYVQLNYAPSEEKERSCTRTGGALRGCRVQKATVSLYRTGRPRARQRDGFRLECLQGNCSFAAKPSL